MLTSLCIIASADVLSIQIHILQCFFVFLLYLTLSFSFIRYFSIAPLPSLMVSLYRVELILERSLNG